MSHESTPNLPKLSEDELAAMSPEQLLQQGAQLGQQITLQKTQTGDPYHLLRQEFAGIPRGRAQVAASQGLRAFSDLSLPESGHRFGFVTSADGTKLLFKNGVIADIAARDVLFGPAGASDPDVLGSDAWVLKIQDTWSDEKAQEWRKKLYAQGYEVAPTGGMAHDLLEGLRGYHKLRYLNYGKVQPLTTSNQVTRESLRQQGDFVALKEEMKTWGQIPFGEDLDDKTADYFAERLIRITRKLMNQKGLTLETALGTPGTTVSPPTGAYLRVQKEFTETPGVKESLQEAEQDEMDESLRQTIVSIAQLGSID